VVDGQNEVRHATWKLWGNEVSLLRMGLNGTDAMATLLALNAISTLATSVGTTPHGRRQLAVAGAIVAAVTAGASRRRAGRAGPSPPPLRPAARRSASGGRREGRPDGSAGSHRRGDLRKWPPQRRRRAPVRAGSGGGADHRLRLHQARRAGQQGRSAFVAASGKQDALASFFTRFLLNCDQWDGYNAERKALMAHLKTNNIGNVVALTGDIHSFFAGTVNDDFDATGGGTP
jgi:alkaline phosphatase D